jgi:hypothetical protein
MTRFLERALPLVQADVDATLPEVGPLRFRWTPPGDTDGYYEAFVALQGGCSYSSQIPLGGSSFLQVLGCLADCTQECIMDIRVLVWPVCPT